MMTVISEGAFLENGIAFSGVVCYNLGVRVGGRLARVNRNLGEQYE